MIPVLLEALDQRVAMAVEIGAGIERGGSAATRIGVAIIDFLSA